MNRWRFVGMTALTAGLACLSLWWIFMPRVRTSAIIGSKIVVHRGALSGKAASESIDPRELDGFADWIKSAPKSSTSWTSYAQDLYITFENGSVNFIGNKVVFMFVDGDRSVQLERPQSESDIAIKKMVLKKLKPLAN